MELHNVETRVVHTNGRSFRKSRESIPPSPDAQGAMLERDPSRGPYLHTLHSPFRRAVSFSSLFLMPRSIWLGTIWQILAKEKRRCSSLSLPVGEIVFVMYKEIHGGDSSFAAEVLFHLNMVKTCQFHRESTGLSICR